MPKRIYLERLSLIEANALIEVANLGMADTDAWSAADCDSYGWSLRKSKAVVRAVEKIKRFRDQLQDRQNLRR